MRSSSAGGAVGIAAQSRAPHTVSDARETPRFAHEDPLLANGMISCVAVPDAPPRRRPERRAHGLRLRRADLARGRSPGARGTRRDCVGGLLERRALPARRRGEGAERGDPRQHRRRHRRRRPRREHRPVERDRRADQRRARRGSARPPRVEGAAARSRGGGRRASRRAARSRSSAATRRSGSRSARRSCSTPAGPSPAASSPSATSPASAWSSR